MKSLFAHTRKPLKDLLFIRVCTAVFGIISASIGTYGLTQIDPHELLGWLVMLFLGLIAGWGFYMIYAAFVGGSQTIKRVADGLGRGSISSAILLFFVAIIALPITVLIRAVKRAS